MGAVTKPPLIPVELDAPTIQLSPSAFTNSNGSLKGGGAGAGGVSSGIV
ncbi:Uncharacterised protein [Mycobacterium tuberculosis]|uniref:Uncharacterized protein n=1 Tax=Mycobacterium tuberculosis TaxID=1773 RepID=A0A0T9E7B7_MYCTX|nr:Uncharacterised protein [Mycobacterium tuberculosis]CFA21718.1 Uncharacterised protein [Mycobacterium tuberculosis]CFA28274.1 Uncharacterised protein [Mycobacterium tuberculosis]CFB15429.1 Uncharacterised protein [Mycobacterium tuberculosis]CFC71527.1 Uncharacterised protein [Mycobacterium tuberculosis]